jgi:CBS domain-containing protein
MRNEESPVDAPVCVFPETEIAQAARLMRDCGVSALLVGNGERVIGIVSERDIVTRHVAEDDHYQDVSSIMTPLPPLPRSAGARRKLSVVTGGNGVTPFRSTPDL